MLGILNFTWLSLLLIIEVIWQQPFLAPYPAIVSSTDSTVIARGKYLVYGPAHCAMCHVPQEHMEDLDQGIMAPLSGGGEFSFPMGTFRAPNLTSDQATGIGQYSDGQLARALRHGVSASGHMIFPFMPYQQISDEDLTAIISYLRSTEPVEHEVPASQWTTWGKITVALGWMQPLSPQSPPPVSVEKGVNVAYGGYLAQHVANCLDCHTNRNTQTGDFISGPFGGGFQFGPDGYTQGFTFFSPNLTTDSTTGLLASWTEEVFINRFKAGRIQAGSPMAWGAFYHMDEVDLKALYAYLTSLEPIQNQVPFTVLPPGEED